MALSAKQRAFIEHYVIAWNATEAARRAGYKGDDNTLAVVGHENLRKPKIAEAIQERLRQLVMDADEALIGLADIARSSMEDFVRITDDGPVIDLAQAKQRGKLRLIRKMKTKTRHYIDRTKGDPDGTPVTEIDFEIDLYNRRSALETILQHHDRGPTGAEDDPINHVIRRIVEIRPDQDAE